MAMLVVTTLGGNGVEVEFDVDGILGKNVVVVVGRYWEGRGAAGNGFSIVGIDVLWMGRQRAE